MAMPPDDKTGAAAEPQTLGEALIRLAEKHARLAYLSLDTENHSRDTDVAVIKAGMYEFFMEAQEAVENADGE